MSTVTLNKLKRRKLTEKPERPKKRINRFDGLSEEEVQRYTLPDYLEMNLNIIFIGINPSLMAAHRGRYYAGPGNHFYKLLHESGLTSRCLKYEEDYKLPLYGIGLTNIVSRATRSSSDLKRIEIKEGSKTVKEKLKTYKPKIAVFNGKCIYNVFANKTNDFHFGLQPECIEDIAVWVMPSSSARCANFPKMTDKLHFYIALNKYLQFLKGQIQGIDTSEFLFEGKCKQFIPRTSKMWRRKNMSVFLNGGRIANKDTICLDTSNENVAMTCSTEFIVKRIQTNGNNDTKQTLCIDKESEATIIRGPVKKIFEKNVPSQKEEPVYLHSQIIDIDCIDSNNCQKSIESICMEKRNPKKISQKLTTVKYFDKKQHNESNFISLIKQRLQNKEHNTIDQESNLKSN